MITPDTIGYIMTSNELDNEHAAQFTSMLAAAAAHERVAAQSAELEILNGFVAVAFVAPQMPADKASLDVEILTSKKVTMPKEGDHCPAYTTLVDSWVKAPAETTDFFVKQSAEGLPALLGSLVKLDAFEGEDSPGHSPMTASSPEVTGHKLYVYNRRDLRVQVVRDQIELAVIPTEQAFERYQ